jgi:hypothetical protein
MMKRETFAIAKIYVPAKRPRDRLIPKGRTDQLLLQDVARRLCGDTSSPRSHRLVKALAIPPLRIIAGEVKCQLSRTAVLPKRFAHISKRSRCLAPNEMG